VCRRDKGVFPGPRAQDIMLLTNRAFTVRHCAIIVASLAGTAGSAMAGLSVSAFAGSDAAFNAITSNGALERAVTEGRTGTPGNWQMGIWEQGGVGAPKTTATFGLSNGAIQRFLIQYDGVSTLSYTANGTTISWNALAGTFTDIFIRVRSATDSTMSLTNMSIVSGGSSLSIGTLASTGPVAADYLRVQNDGSSFGAFSISGNQQLSWTSVNPPNGSQLAYQFKFTNTIPSPGALAVVGFGGLMAARRRR
jgi:hypothetical protein